ncbi:hypothetical protein CsSME_00040856 [Camellia sinensis var. sinensis]
MADSSSYASPSIPSNLTLLISNLSSFVTVKLDSTNYIVWKNQMQNILRATKLIGFVDGSIDCPSSTLSDASNKEVSNPEYLQWMNVDAHLLSCITATLSPAIFSSVFHCKTSYEVWTVLQSRFTSLSRSHVHQLKNKMNHLTKKGLSMDAYLTEFKTIADQLALACAPVDDEDIVLLILNGLPAEYNAFKTSIRTRSDSMSLATLSSLLCSEEIHIEAANKNSQASEIPFAYTATTRSFSNRGGSNGSPRSYRGNFSNRGGSRYFRGSSSRRGGKNFQSPHLPFQQSQSSASFQNSPPHHTGSLIVCQICGKYNHTALECWHRMDHNFHTTSGTPKAAYVASASPSQFQSSSAPPTWYVDSAATSHITNDLNQLSDYQPYQGTDQVTIGDGSSLPIHHIGNGLLPTPSDKDTKSILYKGLNSQGLYHAPQSVSMFSSSAPQACFKSTNSPTASSSTAASAPNWHLKLGHPSSTKLHHILNTFHLPSHTSSGLCPHCCVSKTHRLPFSLSNSTVNKPLALIHSDVWGPFSASVSGYKIFGCRCYPWLRPYTSHKLQPKSIPCVFIGYHPSVKGSSSSVSPSSSASPLVPLPVPSSAPHSISSPALPLSNPPPTVPSSSSHIPISSISIDLPLSAPVSTHNAPHISSNTHSMVTRSKSTSLFPTAHLAHVPTDLLPIRKPLNLQLGLRLCMKNFMLFNFNILGP